MIAIVCSEFNSKVTDGLLKGCLVALNKDGVSSEKIDIHKVPGAFELPGKVKLLTIGDTSYDAIITLGCVIKGQTPHFEFISSSVTDNILNMSVKNKKPIGNGIITCLNKKQAIARSKKGAEAANAMLSVLSQ